MRDSSFADYVTDDLLSHIDGISKKSMFGGWGIYKNGVIIALITDHDRLYFKVDDGNRADYEALGSKPFIYKHKTRKPVTMPYWLLPEEIMDDKDALEQWAHKSYDASLRTKKK